MSEAGGTSSHVMRLMSLIENIEATVVPSACILGVCESDSVIMVGSK